MTRRWSDTLQVDCSASDVIAQLMLCHATSTNPKGVVLFSTHLEEHLERNVDAVASAQFAEEQLAMFAALVQADSAKYQIPK